MNSLISEAFCHSSKQPSCVDYGRNLFISQIEHTLILFPCCKSIEDKTSSPNFPRWWCQIYIQSSFFIRMYAEELVSLYVQPACQPFILLSFRRRRKKQQKAQTGFPSGQSGSQPVSKRTLRWGTRPLDQFLFWFPQWVFWLCACSTREGITIRRKGWKSTIYIWSRTTIFLLLPLAGWQKLGVDDACQKRCDACCTFYCSTTIQLRNIETKTTTTSMNDTEREIEG